MKHLSIMHRRHTGTIVDAGKAALYLTTLGSCSCHALVCFKQASTLSSCATHHRAPHSSFMAVHPTGSITCINPKTAWRIGMQR